MKTFKKSALLALLLSCSMMLHAQITLEHTYPTPGNVYGLKLSSGVKYVQQVGGKPYVINVYNKDHSLFKNISLPVDSGFQMYIELISDKLFNLDDSIEILTRLIQNNFPPSKTVYNVKIFDEGGTAIFSRDSASCVNSVSGFEGSSSLIVKFGTESKLILQAIGANGSAVSNLVYSLPGALPQMVKPNQKDDQLANAFPNPSSGAVTIPYALPANVQTGEIAFYDISGRELKRFKVSNQFNTLELENEFQTGTYFYNLITEKSASEARKMIIIK